MSENGSRKTSNIWKEVAGQLSDHVELASLELRYESERAVKNLIVAGAILVLVMTGFIVLQVSFIDGLTKATGMSHGLSALLLGLIYLLMAASVYRLTRRDKRAGPPFASTQRELQETIQWIQKILS